MRILHMNEHVQTLYIQEHNNSSLRAIVDEKSLIAFDTLLFHHRIKARISNRNRSAFYKTSFETSTDL